MDFGHRERCRECGRGKPTIKEYTPEMKFNADLSRLNRLNKKHTQLLKQAQRVENQLFNVAAERTHLLDNIRKYMGRVR